MVNAMNWLPKKTVVVPVDFSDFSLKALETARQLVEKPADLHLIHVLAPISPLEPGVVWGEVDDTSRADNARKAMRQRLAETPEADATIDVIVGVPSHAIADYAKRIGADLIVIPSHGRTGAMHVLIGSTAERVVRFAHCPVLVLRS
jgi:nucleotide-binding universal stress UspA family protein